jgi:hypothetical protein
VPGSKLSTPELAEALSALLRVGLKPTEVRLTAGATHFMFYERPALGRPGQGPGKTLDVEDEISRHFGGK